MPVEFSLELSAENSVLFPLFTGYVARGLLLHLLRLVDPSVSASLHEPNKVKPYSVTPIRFRSKGRVEDKYVLDETKPCRVSFRFLDDDLASLFLKYLSNGGDLLIYDVKFRIDAVRVRSESYDDILDGFREPADLISLRFITPTYLAVLGADYHYMFPDPVKVFMNLIRLWNSFSDGRKFTDGEVGEYMGWLSRNVGVLKYRLETTIAYMREKKATGFVGWVVYELGAEDEWNRITQALAKFAEYSNIGGNRTGGFGVTKVKIQHFSPPI